MSLARVLEPEVMDSAEEARDYDAMDHTEVNRVFVDDLLEAMHRSQSPVLGGTFDDPPAASLAPESCNVNDLARLLDVLDLGTGTALIPIELCRRFEACRVMAVDAAVNMLELARYNVEIAGLTQRIELAHVDAKQLPFHETLFDVVMSNSIVHHIPEPVHVLREAVRITRPGGLLFFRDLLRPQSAAERDQLVETYAAGASDNQKRMFAESLHAALSLTEIRRLVASLGFNDQSVLQTSDRHWTWTARKPNETPAHHT
jgi:ubiquinone/menaquinone biosynthesis C-methylase UbiE